MQTANDPSGFVGMPFAPQLKILEPRLHVGRRQLKMVRHHVAVSTRAPVAIQSFQPPIEEREEAARDCAAGLAATQRLSPFRPVFGTWVGRR